MLSKNVLVVAKWPSCMRTTPHGTAIHAKVGVSATKYRIIFHTLHNCVAGHIDKVSANGANRRVLWPKKYFTLE